MIPLVAFETELLHLRELLEATARREMEQAGDEVDYQFGTMIELPRAALTAGEIAEGAEFFSFGTNDLTQTTLGFSRDDAEGKFLGKYLEMGLIKDNPFETIDQVGVGALMKQAIASGRAARPEHQAGHLRRARRRAAQRRLLPRDRPRLRELQPVPGAARAPGRRARGAG